MSDLQIKSVAPAGGAPGVQQQAAPVDAARSRPNPASVAQKRQALHDAANGATAATQAAADTAAAAPAKPRERVESLEIKLPDGRVVLFGPPTAVALQMRIAGLVGDNLNNFTATFAKTILSVRNIDGQPVPAVGNMVDVQRVANMIGEDGVDLLMLALNQYWPPVTIGELQVVKKNLL